MLNFLEYTITITQEHLLISIILTAAVFLLRKPLKFFYNEFFKPVTYIFLYRGYWTTYLYLANITRFEILNTKVKRNDKVRFFVPKKNRYVEGVIVGLDRENLLYIKEEDELIAYSLDAIKWTHIDYIKKAHN